MSEIAKNVVLGAKMSVSERQRLVDRVQATIPIRYRRRWSKAILGSPGLRNAINAKCYECCGFEDLPRRVVECTVMRCPLHAYRPYQEKEAVNETN